MHVEIFVFEIERNAKAFALNRRKQRRVHIKIDRVAEFVRLAGGFRLDAGGEMQSVVTPHRTLAQTAKQASQRLVPEKVETLLGNFKLHVTRQRIFDAA